MKLYLDTEFNGHGGELISLALASTSGKHFYGELPVPDRVEPWVESNVVPILKNRAEPLLQFRMRLREYLKAREGCKIYADWPADFQYLMDLMCGVEFQDSWMITCQMILLRDTDPKPKLPHNALSDAIALMEWHRERAWRGSRVADGIL